MLYGTLSPGDPRYPGRRDNLTHDAYSFYTPTPTEHSPRNTRAYKLYTGRFSANLQGTVHCCPDQLPSAAHSETMRRNCLFLKLSACVCLRCPCSCSVRDISQVFEPDNPWLHHNMTVQGSPSPTNLFWASSGQCAHSSRKVSVRFLGSNCKRSKTKLPSNPVQRTPREPIETPNPTIAQTRKHPPKRTPHSISAEQPGALMKMRMAPGVARTLSRRMITQLRGATATPDPLTHCSETVKRGDYDGYLYSLLQGSRLRSVLS